jgi:5-methylcytosine-specific restriction endonuclease McrA
MAGHSKRQWQGKFFKCGMRCHYCHVPLVLEEAEKDHLTPISRGGGDSIDNIVPACGECNRRKGPMTEAEYRKAFLTAFEILKGVPSADSYGAFDRIDANWESIKREAASLEPSWAWRNPA